MSLHGSAAMFAEKFGKQPFWHFTDFSNYRSIKTHGGLFSLAEIEKRKIAPIKYLSDDTSRAWDREKGLDKYVRLTFIKRHPLFSRAWFDRQDVHFLEIDFSILGFNGVKITDGVAYAKGTTIHEVESAIRTLGLDILYDADVDRHDPRLKKALKFELLVPDQIPIEYISFP